MTDFSFVMPVKLDSSNRELDLIRLIDVAIRSIERCFDARSLCDFIVIAGENDLNLIAKRAEHALPAFPLTLVPETRVCPILARPQDGKDGYGWQGWHTQQVLKIAAAKVVRSPYYITMDDDVILTRALGREDLIENDRLLIERFTLSQYPQYVPWYDACGSVLKLPGIITPSDVVMGFTPEIVVTSLMRDLHREIETLWPGPFDETLLQLAGIAIPLTRSRTLNRVIGRMTGTRAVKAGHSSSDVERCRLWTEHQLYWTYLTKRGIANTLYRLDGPQLSAYGLWKENASKEEIDAYLLREFHQAHSHFFSVIGSRVKGLDRPYLYRRLAEHLVSGH